MLQWADKVEWLRETVPDSPHLAAQPVIGIQDDFAWDAFWSLHAARQHAEGGYQSVTISDVLAFCALVGLDDPIERARLLLLIQAMDRAVLAFLREEMEKRRRRGG